MTPAPQLTVWYDGGCPLCRREIALYQRLDRAGRIAFVNLASDAPCPIDRTLLLARFHAQEAGQPMVSGAQAFAALWRATPWFKPLGYLAKLPGVLALLERAYLWFLPRRARLVGWLNLK
jgi:predicted DCC family thiol-disulfide oxidoreductase YuxK